MPLNIIIEGTILAAQCVGLAFLISCAAAGISLALIKFFSIR